MSTPQWARFPSFSRSINQICTQDLLPVYSAFALQLWVIHELGVLDKGQISDISGPLIKCSSLQEALELSREWRGVALTFTVKAIHHNVALHLWRGEEKTHLCLFLAAEMMWHESTEYNEGEWLTEFLLAFCSALQADCCGYGRDAEYDFLYKPLEPDYVVSLLRSGTILQMHRPVIHLLKNSVIKPSEVEQLVRRKESRSGFQYREDKSGYYVFWNFRPENTDPVE